MVLETLAAYESWAFLGLRTVLAAVFLYHSIPKLQNPSAMAEHLGIPTAGPFLLGVAELLSSLSVLLGVYPRWGALGFATVMVGALYMKIVKWGVGFAPDDGGGWEFDLTLLAAALLIVIAGAGSLTLL